MSKNDFIPSGAFIQILVLLSGCAALSWEVIWQIKAGLALGVSAWGTAVTLAITMGGICAGAIAMGHALKNKSAVRPVRIYGILECIVGICGLLLGPAFRRIETLDTWIWSSMPGSAPLIHIFGIIAALGIPALCLGATLPVIGLAAQKHKTSIALLYGLNTLGAAAGALIAAFALIPLLGVTHASWAIAAVNLMVGATAINIGKEEFKPPGKKTAKTAPTFTAGTTYLIAFVTGFSTFALEVSWFRSLTSAFKSTTDAFAIMLSCVLIALGLGARIAPLLRKNSAPLGAILACAGILILLTTPLIERFDLVAWQDTGFIWLLIGKWFFMTLYTAGPPILLLGIALPWLLDEQDNPRQWGMLYGFNAFAAIVGSICAAWLLLPVIGFAKTAWLAGIMTAATGIFAAPNNKRAILSILTIAALTAAIVFESGVGKTRVQTGGLTDSLKTVKILRTHEGPDATISAVETQSGHRILIINGFITTLQLGNHEENRQPTHYMPWMGHMPMLLHPDPDKTLVICFGTGQTANAVRNEKPRALDIVDLNRYVFDMADVFPANEGVLGDPVVRRTIMDGRAYIRRTDNSYDVITLEPMPPNFAGVNALYSKEFYELARQKLTPDGIVAQWLPFHLVPAEYSAAIAKTFQSVFPNAILWIDPPSGTGILLGSKNNNVPLGGNLPGFTRRGIRRDMTEDEVKNAIALGPEELKLYGKNAAVITDDNQILSYGKAVYMSHNLISMTQRNRELMEKTTGKELDRYFP